MCIVTVLVSLIGSCLNFLNVITLSSKLFKEKFDLYLKYYSISSCVLNLNDFINWLLYLVYLYIGQQFSYDYVFFQTYVYTVVWTTFYTTGALLDIVLLYERIQILLPHIIHFRSLKPIAVFSLTLIFSVLINIPFNLNRSIHEEMFLVSVCT